MQHIERAIQLKKELDSFRPLKEEELSRIMQKFRLDWNYHSNHLEGNTLTYGETKALVLFGITAQGKPLKDHFEITGHNEAVEWVLDIVNMDRPITENFIRELHTLLLKDSHYKKAITPEGENTKKLIKVGEYKSTPNHVKTNTGEIFRFASVEETPILMHELIAWYKSEIVKKDFNPVITATEFHYKFIRIHPFDDGNGRTARIVMNFILLQFGYPPVIIKTEDKSNYFAVLRQADAGTLTPFIAYITKNLIFSLEIMIKGAKGESIEDPDDIDKEISLLKGRLKALSNPIKISKNKEAILKIYDDSIVTLISTFIKKAKKFDDFYIETEINLLINGETVDQNKTNVLVEGRNLIKESTNSLNIKYHYRSLRQMGLEDIDHASSIIVGFDFTNYTVSGLAPKVVIKKLYSEQLTNEDIMSLVTEEIRRHKDKIEREIDEFKKGYDS